MPFLILSELCPFMCKTFRCNHGIFVYVCISRVMWLMHWVWLIVFTWWTRLCPGRRLLMLTRPPPCTCSIPCWVVCPSVSSSRRAGRSWKEGSFTFMVEDGPTAAGVSASFETLKSAALHKYCYLASVEFCSNCCATVLCGHISEGLRWFKKKKKLNYMVDSTEKKLVKISEKRQ